MASPQPRTDAELRDILETLEAAAYRKQYRAIDFFIPHPKQYQHLMLGATCRERLLMSGNRQGKTHTGGFEASTHATGDYPHWWKGKRFDHPTLGWVVGETSQVTRDVQQGKLCGPPGVDAEFGTGLIPKESIIDKSIMSQPRDAYDTVQIRHKSGGVSRIRFKSYDQGRQRFQGEGLDWIWFDEEPPEDIYFEGLARIGERDGIAWLTFTPLKGRSSVVLRFLDDPLGMASPRGVTLMSIDDALHITPEIRAKMIEGYAPHEREARVRGVPLLGSGRIFTTPEEMIVEAPIAHVPAYWKKLWGIDIGIGHPFGAVLILWDLDNDVIHVHHTVRMIDGLPMNHWQAMRSVGAAVPVAWPKDAGDREKGSGEPITKLYSAQGARMLHEHATWPDGGISTEAGVLEMDEREKTGRLKIAAQLSDYLEERRFYHRKDGQIVKIRDDLMSACRICIMMKRFAASVALGSQVHRRPIGELAVGVDFDVFAGS